MNNYNMTTLRLRQQKINEGKIDVDMTKENKEQKLSDSAEQKYI